MNNTKNDISTLKGTEFIANRTKEKHNSGTIRYLSPQGENLHAAVQRFPTFKTKPNGEVIMIDGGMFGNEPGVSEEELTLTEILIPVDINLRNNPIDLIPLIGMEVTVITRNNYPEMVLLQSKLNKSRVINCRTLREARHWSRDGTLKGEGARAYLESRGYTDETIDAVISESVDQFPRAGIFNYDSVTWSTNLEITDDHIILGESSRAGIVRGLPLTSGGGVGNICYKPVRALTAK
ncbi:MAG: hypothetical protein DRQ78_00115 [Epsilonproteobacteria bacterium]|nr:MAG: hypothetical protein DRQ78_00115 [Campylobacterota bacterium]